MEELLRKLSEATGVEYSKLYAQYDKDLQFIDYEPSYFRLKGDLAGLEEGTIAFDVNGTFEIIRGHPKTPRALTISSAFKNNFKEAYIEEKMNGYNVRTCVVGGEFVAITRKGLVCNYTTMRIEEELNLKFFRDNPELVLCGEVVGLQNPYQEKSYPEERDFGYYVFDIRKKGTGEPLNYGQKWALIKKYGIKAVRSFGKFKSGTKILALTRKLGAAGREGVVIKSADMKTQLKYTANQSTNDDLSYAFKFYADYGQQFMFKRIVREAFQASEMKLTRKQLEKEASELGKNILMPLVETINAVKSGKNVSELFEISVPDKEFGYDFVDNLAYLGVKLKVRSVRKKGKGFVMALSREYQSTKDHTRNYLEGGFYAE